MVRGYCFYVSRDLISTTSKYLYVELLPQSTNIIIVWNLFEKACPTFATPHIPYVSFVPIESFAIEKLRANNVSRDSYFPHRLHSSSVFHCIEPINAQRKVVIMLIAFSSHITHTHTNRIASISYPFFDNELFAVRTKVQFIYPFCDILLFWEFIIRTIYFYSRVDNIKMELNWMKVFEARGGWMEEVIWNPNHRSPCNHIWLENVVFSWGNYRIKSVSFSISKYYMKLSQIKGEHFCITLYCMFDALSKLLLHHCRPKADKINPENYGLMPTIHSNNP